MDAREITRLVELVRRRIHQSWGKDWRHMLSRPVQQAIVSHEVLNLLLSSTEQIDAAQIPEIAAAAYEGLQVL